MRQNFPFILASSSPQRQTLLARMGVRVYVLPVDLEENHSLGSNSADLVEILALQKLSRRLHEAHTELHPGAFVMAADTIVSVEDQRLGKPQNLDHARNFLKMLSGRTHEVITSLVLYIPATAVPDPALMEKPGPFRILECSDLLLAGYEQYGITIPDNFCSQGILTRALVATRLRFMPISDSEIEWYLSFGEYEGAAGGYRIQGRAECFIQEINGSYSNVMGLPINVLYDILRRTSLYP